MLISSSPSARQGSDKSDTNIDSMSMSIYARLLSSYAAVTVLYIHDSLGKTA